MHALISGIGAAAAGVVAVVGAAAMVSAGGAGPTVPSVQTTLCGAPSVVLAPGGGGGPPAGLGSAPSPSPDPATAQDSAGDATAAGGSDGMDLCQDPAANATVTPATP